MTTERLDTVEFARWQFVDPGSFFLAFLHPAYRGSRFPKPIIQHAIWLYLRFTFSLRDVEELLAEHGIGVTYETVQIWVARFGPLIAKGLHRRREPSSGIWMRCL